MKIFVNITSWTRVDSAGAEHFYAIAEELQSTENIYSLARNGWQFGNSVEIRKILDQTTADKLNRKDRLQVYKAGETTQRFDTIDEIKERVKELYPNTDLAFFNDRELLSENDIYEAQPQSEYRKTGEKIRIQNFEGFSQEFVNLTEGSIHEVIETPEKYKDKELQPGVWVWGLTEPVLVLRREFEYLNE